MSETTGEQSGRSQADLLEKQIKKIEESGDLDNKMLPFLRTQMNYLRRGERQRAGLEKPWPNPCG